MIAGIRQLPAWAVWCGGSALALSMTWMAYAWVVAPNHERAHEAEAINTAAATEHDKAIQLEAVHAAMAEAYAERRDAMDRMPNKLGDRRALNRQIASLIELAQSQGLEVLQLQPGETTPGEQYDLTEMRLELVAPFPRHLDFLEALHRDFPDMSVVGMELENRRRGPHPRPHATVSLVWFTAVAEVEELQAAATDR